MVDASDPWAPTIEEMPHHSARRQVRGVLISEGVTADRDFLSSSLRISAGPKEVFVRGEGGDWRWDEEGAAGWERMGSE